MKPLVFAIIAISTFYLGRAMINIDGGLTNYSRATSLAIIAIAWAMIGVLEFLVGRMP